MFMASAQFEVVKGQEETFENLWAARSSRFHEMPGFISFRFQKGPERGNHVLYFSLTTWATQQSFLAWRYSEQFMEGYENGGKRGRVHQSPCRLEEFETICSRTNPQ